MPFLKPKKVIWKIMTDSKIFYYFLKDHKTLKQKLDIRHVSKKLHSHTRFLQNLRQKIEIRSYFMNSGGFEVLRRCLI
jgi:hypothetical protein